MSTFNDLKTVDTARGLMCKFDQLKKKDLRQDRIKSFLDSARGVQYTDCDKHFIEKKPE